MSESSQVEQTPADDRVPGVAHAQRRLLLGILAAIIANIAVGSVNNPSTPASAVLMVALIALAVVAFDVYWLVRLCRALGVFPWVYAVGTLIPVLGVLVLAIVNGKATAFLKGNGVKVGLLGARV
jgi:hypothetical protein